MYPSSPTPKKTIVGLPIRNIDYGSLHKSLKVADRDVKRNLQPQFLENLDKMCLDSSGRSECGNKVEQAGGRPGNIISHHDNLNRSRVETIKGRDSPLLNVTDNPPNIKNSYNHNCSPAFCGICRRSKENMSTHYGIYQQDEKVDLVMGGVIDRIDHLIERLGKGGYDRKAFGAARQEKKNDSVGIRLPCEACAVRGQKRYNNASCQTEEEQEDLEEEQEELVQESVDEVKALDRSTEAPADTSKIPVRQITRSSSSNSIKTTSGVYTDVEDDNMSVLSSDDEFAMDVHGDEENVPQEIQEYEIAASTRQQMPEVGTTETVHFRMLPYHNLYVWGHRKFVGTLPPRVALKCNYDLNYHITIFKNLSSDRPDIRMKRLKELVTAKTKSSPRRGPVSRTIDNSKLGNILVVDIPRYSRQGKRQSSDKRIPVVNLRDGYCSKLWLSERVSDILLARSPRLRFAIEIAKSNRAHWKLTAKDLCKNQRPYQYKSLYGGKSYQQFYLAEMKRFAIKPLQSRCLIYYADLYEDNTKDHVKSKSFVSCLGNQTSKDTKSTPIVHFEERIKEHIRAGQKLYDPKVNIFNVALQNPNLGLDEPGRLLPQKGSSEITKCPNLLFVPLDFGFSTWSRPTTQDHLAPLKQSYVDIFCSNGPAGYNI